MATVFDVAKYILQQQGEITAMKLQKLAYYSQVWTLVWNEKPLFEERIEAWSNGAVIPELYQAHRGRFKINEKTFNYGQSSNLTEEEKHNIDKVLSFYGGYSAQELSDINHQEKPWIEARNGIHPLVKCNNEITHDLIFEYHSGIWNEPEEF